MAQIQKGETFTDVSPGKSVTSTRLNNHVDGAVLLPGAITEQTTVGTAIASDDTLIIHDQSASGLKKVEAQHLLPPEIISAKTDISTAIADGDLLLMADVSASNALLKVQAQNLLPPGVITSKTDLSTAIATDDVLLVSDTSASGALKKVQAANLIAVEAITSKTDISTAIAGDDVLLVSDTSASGALKKVQASAVCPTFTVSAISIVTGSCYNNAHSLGATPKVLQARLVMGATTELGYAQNDEVDILGMGSSGTWVGSPFVLGCNATNVFLVCQDKDALYLPHKSTGALTALDETKWTAKIIARL